MVRSPSIFSSRLEMCTVSGVSESPEGILGMGFPEGVRTLEIWTRVVLVGVPVEGSRWQVSTAWVVNLQLPGRRSVSGGNGEGSWWGMCG